MYLGHYHGLFTRANNLGGHEIEPGVSPFKVFGDLALFFQSSLPLVFGGTETVEPFFSLIQSIQRDMAFYTVVPNVRELGADRWTS